ncbi:hypothetical protein [Helicobacter labacensis]|uniref:hypothetical protein n=1 Tax=Helicobacter labacensis TaxID=2316079 RepID=UPI000EB38AF1|nr:hypothetical protein [Helicobacter labacensis]
MKKIPYEKTQRICELRQQGLTQAKIARHEDVGVSQATVSKHLAEQAYLKEIQSKDEELRTTKKELRTTKKELRVAKVEIVGLKATISLIESDLQLVKSKIEELESEE